MADPFVAVNGIAFSVGSEAEGPEIVGLLVGAFLKTDPLALGAGLTAAEFEAFVALLAAHVVGQGLTIVARSEEAGEMAGVLLTEDSATPPPAGMDSLSPKIHPISDILGRLNAEHTAGRVRRRGESAHLYLLGVAERFAGRGIAQHLVTQCLANAAQRGFLVAVAEATNRTSQHIFRKQGFAERVWGSYRDHRYEGKAYFAAFEEHGGPVLMDRLLEPIADR
jgi:ribosomal protein S18 acetylase RimI-like enzyme